MEPLPAREHRCGVDGVRIVRLDESDLTPRGDRLWRAWFALHNDVARRTRGPSIYVKDADFIRSTRAGSRKDLRLLLALAGDEPVAAAELARWPDDDPATANLLVEVPESQRGRGLGRALHEALLTEAAESGCSAAIANTWTWPGRRDPVARDDAFLTAAGYRRVHAGTAFNLPLPLPERFRAAAVRLAQDPPGYAVETWVGSPPPEVHPGIALLKERFSADVPHGDREVAVERWDAARVARDYDGYAQHGETLVVSVARADDGAVAALTELSWPPSAPDAVYQGATIVLPEHRGRGLGGRLKARAIERVVPLCPGARRCYTFVAQDNPAMRATNARLGYQPDFTSVTWHRPLRPADAQVPAGH